MVGAWIRGKLALAGMDLSTPDRVWLDAVWSLWVEAPDLQEFNRVFLMRSAMLRPEEARRTWGKTGVHAALSGGLGTGRGAEAGGGQPVIPKGRRPQGKMI